MNKGLDSSMLGENKVRPLVFHQVKLLRDWESVGCPIHEAICYYKIFYVSFDKVVRTLTTPSNIR